MNYKKAYQNFRFGLSARISLYERLADFLDNKFPIDDTLETISLRYKKQKDYRADILNIWRKKIAIGQKFSEAIKDHVPSAERILIASGESGSGGLPQGLREAIRLSKSMAAVKTAIIAGVSYPLALVGMMCLLIAMFATQISPIFKSILPVSQWPESGQTLDMISEFVVVKWWIVLGIICAIGYALAYLMPRWSGSGRQIADNFPPFSIYREYQGASFLIALSSMMISGISLNESLLKIQAKGSPWLKNHINKMLKKLRVAGSEYGKTMDTGMLDQETAGDIEDYSKLSSFEQAVYRIGENTLKKSIIKINARMAVLKNLMLACVAGMLLWVLASSYLLQQTVAENAGKSQRNVPAQKAK